MEKNMKALVLKGIRDMSLKQVPIPEPEIDEVLIKVKAAAICHTDFAAIDGEHSMISYPCIPGHEFSGIVEKTGGAVRHIRSGDRVTALGYSYCGVCRFCRRGLHTGCENMIAIPFHYDGAFAQYVKVPAISVYIIPDDMRFEDAAMVEPSANGLSAVDRADIYPGDNIIIAGPGPIGLLATQFAALKLPDKLIVTGTRDERLDIAKKLGATDTINIRKEDTEKRIDEITGGRGIDAILYCGGGQEVWDMAENKLGSYGRFILEAVPPKVESKFTVTPFRFLEKQMTYTGVSGYNGAQFKVALEMIYKGKIKTKSITTHFFSLDEYEKAFEVAEKRLEGAIKVIINKF